MTRDLQGHPTEETSKEPPAAFLAPRRRPVTRYRPALIGLVGAALGAICVGALVIGLSPPRRPARDPADTRVEAAAAASPMDASLTSGLSDYADPEGPLGAAAAAVRQNDAPKGSLSSPAGAARVDPSPGDAEAAARSGPFFAGGAPSSAIAAVPSPTPRNDAASEALSADAPQIAASELKSAATAGAQTAQDQKVAFVASGRSASGALSYSEPPSAYEVQAGEVIPAALVTAIDSDLPGEVIAQVTQNVYDTATGRFVLIPQGSRLIGRYDSHLAYGQGRALMMWNRIVMPDGRSVELGAMTGADLAGASGLEDKVDTHIGPLTRAIALSTAITVGGAAAQTASARSTGGLVLNDASSGLSAQASQVGERFVDRDLNRQPTVEIRQGWPLTVIVSKDLVLQPY